ncbi:trypsin-1 [Lasioglossum baleicum]|uniref:trypsin-1 n=1 Tax=Lasioglossum baleicum TaxID=434251 RepID=UPI003FCE6A7E
MEKIVAFLGLLALVAGIPVDESIGSLDLRMDGRIVGGEPTVIEQAPYQVSLQRNGRHFCGGSIIAKNWVLTAGHCTTYSPSAYEIRTGSTKVNQGTVHRVEAVYRHKSYSSNRYGVPLNDISLLKIVASDAFVFNNQRKAVKLNEGNSAALVGKNGLVTGWGTTNSGTPSVLQKVSVPMISKDKCDKAYTTWGGVPVGEICAGFDAGGKDSCQGDSGGPLVVDGRLAGVVSWGKGCGTAKFPGVYTDVAYYRQWIRENSGV